MLRLDIQSLAEGVHSVRLTPAASDLDLDPALFRAVVVEARLDYRNEDPRSRRLYVAFTAAAQATLVCDRTLVPFEQEIRGTHAVLFVPASALPPGDDHDDAMGLLPEHNQPIDLAETVRDTLLLAIPARRLAPGAEDVPIPLQFGASDESDGPADPRWDALRGLAGDA